MNRSVKLTLAFVLVFAMAAFSFTFYSIEKARESAKTDITPTVTTTEMSTEKSEIPSQIPVLLNEKPIDLYGTYDTNDIVVNTVIEMKGDTEIDFPEISGLKNKEVEGRINDDIRRNIQQLVSRYDSLNYANFYVRANFGNVISISYNIGSDEKYEQIYLNYELVNGNKLQLEDLFMQDTDVLSVVRKAFYDASVAQSWYTWDGDIVSPDENDVYKLVKRYMEGDDKVFSFTPIDISFYVEGQVATSRMIDYYDEISIYSKYLTDESIYENDDVGYENIFTCADSNYDVFRIIDYGYAEPNMWYDVTVWQENEDYQDDEVKAEIREFNDNFYQQAYDLVEEQRMIAQNHPEKFYIVLIKPRTGILSKSESINDQWVYDYSNAVETHFQYQIFEMPIELFESRYRDEIIETYRYPYFAMRGGAYLSTDDADVAIIDETISEIYDYKTGVKLNRFTDIFADGFDFMGYVEDRTKTNLLEQGYCTPENVDDVFTRAEIRMDGANIIVNIPEVGYLDYIMLLDFDKSQLKIFDQEG